MLLGACNGVHDTGVDTLIQTNRAANNPIRMAEDEIQAGTNIIAACFANDLPRASSLGCEVSQPLVSQRTAAVHAVKEEIMLRDWQ